MPIARLPESTTRAIGSSLVLNDASSVVKELLDNALDAFATAIAIEISVDTLDVIQVKDNGTGIGVEDRQLVCKRGCTSKIRTMEDLGRLGGSSLGFRGEALASVAELSEAVVVTTRLDGEYAGTAMKFARGGALLSASSASHAVGTTFRVQGFLQALPVRQQTAKRGAQKTLASIKKLLYAYAYARPTVRLSFKVLRAKNEKANWNYGPKTGSSSLQDATVKIAGQEVAAQCESQSACSEPKLSTSGEQVSYSIDAVLAKSKAGSSKVHNAGHYVSVDGRPVSSNRGIIKDIIKLYKSYYRAASFSNDGTFTTIDPFLCIHLVCPLGSYDVNIEPAKDDVLFSDIHEVMSLVEDLFKRYYGEKGPGASVERNLVQKKPTPVLDNSFDILLAKKSLMIPGRAASGHQTHSKPDSLENESDSAMSDEDSTENVHRLTRLGEVAFERQTPENQEGSTAPDLVADLSPKALASMSHFNMFGVDDEDLIAWESPPPIQDSNVEECEEDGLRSVQVTNPWSLARLHAPIVRQAVQSQLMTPGPGQSGHTKRRSIVAQGDSASHQSFLPSPATPSPSSAGYQNPGPPLRRRPYHEREEQEDDDIQFTQDIVPEPLQRCHATSLDTWVQPAKPTVRLPASQRAANIYKNDDSFTPLARTGFQPPDGNLEGSQSIQLTEANGMSAESCVNSSNITKRFGSPIRVLNHALPPSFVGPTTPDMMTEADLACGTSSLPQREPFSAQSQGSIVGLDNLGQEMPPPPSPTQRSFKASRCSNLELADILDFEQRKKALVTQQRKSHRSKLPRSELSPAQLAQMQLNGTSGHWTQSSPTKKSLPNLDLREEESNPAKDFARRFNGSEQEEHSTTTAHNSPHNNRYLAAKQRLSHAHPESGTLQVMGDEHAGTENLINPIWSKSEGPNMRLPENDPRAYLIRHRANDSNSNGITGLPKTNLKIRRTKTTHLPLETIPPEIALHDLKATIKDPFSSPLTLSGMCRWQKESDDYVRTGENTFVRWSENSRSADAWEARVNQMVNSKFKAQMANEEGVIPEITLTLTTAIKAHANAHDS